MLHAHLSLLLSLDATGQCVRTAFGDGVVLAFLDRDDVKGSRYLIKFRFGTGYIRASAIMHGIKNPDGSRYVRRGGVMEKETSCTGEASESNVQLDKKFKLLFGSECIYLFIRLYTSLVSMLDDIETFVRENPARVDPIKSYYDPMKTQEDRSSTKLDFASVVSNLKRVICGSLSAKEYEAFCRRVSSESVHKMVALPKLIERGALMLKRTAHEDLLLQLFDCCLYPGAVSVSKASDVT